MSLPFIEEEGMEMAKQKRATFKERIAINEKLKDVIVARDNGTCEYKGNYSDKAIADELGVSAHSVKYVRAEMYGLLTGGPRTMQTKKLDDVVTVAAHLASGQYLLTDHFNKLVLMLSLQQIVNCRHLEIKQEGKG